MNNPDRKPLPDLTNYIQLGRPYDVLQSRHIMKHKITVLICIIVIAVGALYANHLYHDYQVQQANISAAQAKVDKEAAQREAQFQAGVQMDEAQCARDTLAYNALTPAAKLKASAPACEVNLIQ